MHHKSLCHSGFEILKYVYLAQIDAVSACRIFLESPCRCVQLGSSLHLVRQALAKEFVLVPAVSLPMCRRAVNHRVVCKSSSQPPHMLVCIPS